MSVFGFGDPDEALDLIQAMQRARQAYGEAPDEDFMRKVLAHIRSSGLAAEFVRVLDDGEDAVMIWILEIETGRGRLELRRNPLMSWRDFLAHDELAKALNLLPPEILRGG